jgi:hypothetical protein
MDARIRSGHDGEPSHDATHGLLYVIAGLDPAIQMA